MDKSAYLDAMGITRWIGADKVVSAYTILVDKFDANLEVHPLIGAVLASADCLPTHCSISDSVSGSNTQVLWDMRRLKRPSVDSKFSSSPIAQLANSADDKRKLWHELSCYIDSVGNDKTDEN
ncbi:hypothetical protein FM038_019035 [Shewanella eurypsychrophilus]|uniref:DNA polymerase III subunit psi n=1 Tax=Shewanella eurypsychrophilus TaxID=2593656 RepID=A0ABX6VFU5_9GAMM|nr:MULTISPECIES: hypothetical protein [Shewanella]QFU24039.1 hypothetical protein FS418_20770 [Shewanella sp. YLB-09]QPG59248.1 hypothetical protein FM038_019035 [Shewanella eurypsychrophilus]